MFYRILIILTFLCLSDVQAQEISEETVNTKVNEALKNLDWAGIDKYNQLNELQISKSSPDAVFMGDSITEGLSVFLAEFLSNNNFINRGIG